MALDREYVKRMVSELRAKMAELDACPGPHDFPEPTGKLGEKFTCTRCGGTVDRVARLWYVRGLEHGRLP